MSKFLDLEGLGYYTQCFKPGLVELVDGGAKNMLDCSINALKQKLTTGTWNNNVYTIPTGDISITVNTDNTLIVSATNVTTNKTITIGYVEINMGELYFSCTPNEEGAGTKFRSGINYVGYDDGEGINVPNLTTRRAIQLEIVGSSASPTTISNIVYKPMLCTKAAWNISQTYQPYRPSEDEQNAQIETNKNNILSYIGLGTEIAVNSDLNDYNNVGAYYSGGATIGSTLSNCPTIQPFRLIVDYWQNTTNRIQRIIAVEDTTTFKVVCFIRVKSSTGYKQWTKFEGTILS